MYSRTLARKLVQLVVHQLPAVSCRWCDALSPAVVAQGAAAAAGGAAHAQGAGAGAAQKVSAAAAAPKVCTPVLPLPRDRRRCAQEYVAAVS